MSRGDHKKRDPAINGRSKKVRSDVGYGRPPREHQFKPGKSGNDKGRPPGSKSEEAILEGLLSRKIPIRSGGRQRKISVREAVWHRITDDALRGNLKAAAFLFNRSAALEAAVPHVSELTEDDRAVLEAYANDVLSKSKKDATS